MIIMASDIFNNKKWQAEEDARTLAKYQEIIGDPKRKSAAVKAANSMATDLAKRANALKLAAGGRIKKK